MGIHSHGHIQRHTAVMRDTVDHALHIAHYQLASVIVETATKRVDISRKWNDIKYEPMGMIHDLHYALLWILRDGATGRNSERMHFKVLSSVGQCLDHAISSQRICVQVGKIGTGNIFTR